MIKIKKQPINGCIVVRKTEIFIKDLLANADVDVKLNGDRPWDMRVHDASLYDAVSRHGSLGLGEAYMAGLWDCAQLDAFFHRILRARLDEKVKTVDVAWMAVVAKLRNNQSISRAWEVGKVHYNLGNAFYRDMLGPTMAYSCGYWADAGSLDEAQNAKLDLICRKLGLQPGMTLLDIGCGWGSLMKYAAEHYGVSCTGVTISSEQAAYGAERCKGLPVTFSLMDYRGLQGTFDRIASVGMFEHVGRKNYHEFFQVARRNLAEDGLMLLHTIGGNFCKSTTDAWVNKYIFPNGEIPSLAEIAEAAQDYFVMEDVHNFGADYDTTLMAWHANFEQIWPRYKDQYPAHFYRMWRYYLLCCAGTFRARSNQLWQIVLSPDGQLGGYRRPHAEGLQQGIPFIADSELPPDA